ncbi:MAG TPA: hypothetical protein VFC21_06000 [Bryobacteraceae bacterium]|nr:hypothetical protein [Bryobacteraceae bacterium]
MQKTVFSPERLASVARAFTFWGNRVAVAAGLLAIVASAFLATTSNDAGTAWIAAIGGALGLSNVLFGLTSQNRKLQTRSLHNE